MLERAWSVLGVWTVFLSISLALLWAVIGLGPIEEWISVASFLSAIATTFALAVLAAAGAWRQRRTADDSPAPEAIPDFSFPTVLAGLALAAMALGLELGPWLILIGAGVLMVAVGSVVAEHRATREAAERAGG